MGGAVAGTTTFTGATEFTFSGYNNGAGPVNGNLLSACAPGFMCHVVYGDAQYIAPAPGQTPVQTRVISTAIDQVQAGAAVRGTLESLDPQGSLTYYSMEFDLYTKDFFSKNPGGHITVAPRAFLPFLRTDPGYEGSPYHGYPTFQSWPGSSPAKKVPHAYGDGIILGSVPCTNGLPRNNQGERILPSPAAAYSSTGLGNGIAIEQFVGPAVGSPLESEYNTSPNITACPLVRTVAGAATGSPAQLSFEDNSIYAIKVFVKQYTCVDTGNICRTVGYSIQKTSPAAGPVVKGGGDESSFRDMTQGGASWGAPARSWAALQSSDLSSWFISNVLTSPLGQYDNWEFQVKNFSVNASNSAPGWW